MEDTVDELRDSILNSQDKVLYDEAQLCISSGAYRAAFIVSWIGAAEGLLGKLREMGTLHADLRTFVGQFERSQQSGDAKDVELISKAFEMGLINQPERIELDAIRNLRNQYGHPTSMAPDKASASHALHIAVTAVLAKPVLIMHGAARELAKRAAVDPHLVPQDGGTIDAFTLKRADVMHRNARPIFIRELIAGANEKLDDINSRALGERCIRMAVCALSRWAEKLTNPPWNVDQLQRDFPSVSVAIFTDPTVWPLIQSEDQDKVLSRCLSREPTYSSGLSVDLLANADRLDALRLLSPAQSVRVNETLESSTPWLLLGNGVRTEFLARSIIRALVDSSFDVARGGVSALIAMRKDEILKLSVEYQRELGRSLAYAAEHNTWDAINALESIAATPQDWPTEVRAGAVVGGLTGKSYPLQHGETSEAALKIALADSEGYCAQAAVDALKPDSTFGVPPRLYELRTILDGEPSTQAVTKLREFFDRLEHEGTIS